MKTKKDRFNSLFVSVKNRLPPDKEDVKILYKNKDGSFGISTGNIFNVQQRQIKQGLEVSDNLKHTGYFAISWTILYEE